LAYATSLSVPYSKECSFIWERSTCRSALLVLVDHPTREFGGRLDGLACGTLSFSALTYSLFAYLAGHARFTVPTDYPVPGAGELTVVLAALIRRLPRFLWYNAHPAEVFMGDTGSLFLGAPSGWSPYASTGTLCF